MTIGTGQALRVAVTGAAGFVGRAACRCLLARGHEVLGLVRKPGAGLPEGVTEKACGDLATAVQDSGFFADVDVIVHLAARVHRMREDAADPLAAHRAANRDLALALARSAMSAGVRRVVLASTVKVMGENSPGGRPFTEADRPAPLDPYGVSKLEAEEALFALSAGGRIESVALRPPLVHGPGVRANFERLMRAVAGGLPLPFGLVRNKRSLLHVDNLALALAVCAERPEAAGRVFLVRDGCDLSTADLIRLIGEGLGRPARLLPIPPALLRLGASCLGRGAAADRLLGDLCVDDSAIRRDLGYAPAVDAEEGIRMTARAFAAGERA